MEICWSKFVSFQIVSFNVKHIFFANWIVEKFECTIKKEKARHFIDLPNGQNTVTGKNRTQPSFHFAPSSLARNYFEKI